MLGQHFETLDLIDLYESKLKEFELLNILKDSLTPKGMETLIKIDKWLKENLSKYLELQSTSMYNNRRCYKICNTFKT